MSPTGRTLKFLRAGGFLAAVVETWIPKLERRRDLFGGFDVIGLKELERLLVSVDKARARVVLVCDEEQLETMSLIPRSLLWSSQRAPARAP